MTKADRREDILVSVCFADFSTSADSGRELALLASRIAARYRYWEVLLIVDADADQEAEQQRLLTEVGNLRLLKVRHATPFYRRRVAVASEAIGDVVVLAALEELPGLDVIEMIEAASAKGAIVVGQRRNVSMMNPALHALGRGAGFRVSLRDMLTAAYPRTLLNQLLAHPDRQLALRFPPADDGIPMILLPFRGKETPSRTLGEVGRRLSLVQRLLVSSAPYVLTLLALASLLVAFSGLAVAVYAIVTWLTLDTIAPGWFTTSLVLSLTASFLGTAIFGLSIGMQKVIESLSRDAVDDIMSERSAVDLFGQVMQELNVEVAEAPAAGARDGA